MSLFLSQSPDASVYLSHPFALCQFINMSSLSLVILGECSACDVSLFLTFPFLHSCEYNDYQRIHMELSRSHNSLFITQRQSHTKDTHPHLFLLLPSRLLFCLYAPAPTTHTLPLLLNQQKGGARWRRSITVTGGVRQPAEQPCVALSVPLETTLSVSHSYKLY